MVAVACIMTIALPASAQVGMFPYSAGSVHDYDSEDYSSQVNGIKNPDAPVRGTIAFELTKTAQGSGRIFGQAAGIPYTKIEIYNEDGTQRLSPEPGWFSQHNFSDEIGQFSWNEPFPN